jgi:hypothetical protein
MSVKTISELGHQLTVQVWKKTDQFGRAYWQARAMFRIAGDSARVDVITASRHGASEAAERAVVQLARDNGWGRS